MIDKIESKEQLIEEIAEAIQERLNEVTSCLDLTTQTVTDVPSQYLDDFFDNDDDGDDDEDDVDDDGDDEEFDPVTGIPLSEIREQLSHDLVVIQAVTSHDGFEIMRDFAIQENNDNLFRALDFRHPFRAFRDAVERENLLQKWYHFRDEEYKQLAIRWLEDNDIDFVDGKVSRIDSQDEI